MSLKSQEIDNIDKDLTTTASPDINPEDKNMETAIGSARENDGLLEFEGKLYKATEDYFGDDGLVFEGKMYKAIEDGGNPNHDKSSGKFTTGGGSSKKSDKKTDKKSDKKLTPTHKNILDRFFDNNRHGMPKFDSVRSTNVTNWDMKKDLSPKQIEQLKGVNKKEILNYLKDRITSKDKWHTQSDIRTKKYNKDLVKKNKEQKKREIEDEIKNKDRDARLTKRSKKLNTSPKLKTGLGGELDKLNKPQKQRLLDLATRRIGENPEAYSQAEQDMYEVMSDYADIDDFSDKEVVRIIDLATRRMKDMGVDQYEKKDQRLYAKARDIYSKTSSKWNMFESMANERVYTNDNGIRISDGIRCDEIGEPHDWVQGTMLANKYCSKCHSVATIDGEFNGVSIESKANEIHFPSGRPYRNDYYTCPHCSKKFEFRTVQLIQDVHGEMSSASKKLDDHLKNYHHISESTSNEEGSATVSGPPAGTEPTVKSDDIFVQPNGKFMDDVGDANENDVLSQIRNGIIDPIANTAIVMGSGGIKLLCATCGKDFGIIPEDKTGWNGNAEQKAHNNNVHGGGMYNESVPNRGLADKTRRRVPKKDLAQKELTQRSLGESDHSCPLCGDTFSSDTMIDHLTGDHKAEQYNFMKGDKWGESLIFEGFTFEPVGEGHIERISDIIYENKLYTCEGLGNCQFCGGKGKVTVEKLGLKECPDCDGTGDIESIQPDLMQQLDPTQQVDPTQQQILPNEQLNPDQPPEQQSPDQETNPAQFPQQPMPMEQKQIQQPPEEIKNKNPFGESKSNESMERFVGDWWDNLAWDERIEKAEHASDDTWDELDQGEKDWIIQHYEVYEDDPIFRESKKKSIEFENDQCPKCHSTDVNFGEDYPDECNSCGWKRNESKEGWYLPNHAGIDEDNDDFKDYERVERLDINDGDYVDFGAYGHNYVISTNYGQGWGESNIDWWITDDEEDRYDSNARGSSISPLHAVRVIEKGNEVKAKENEEDDEYEEQMNQVCTKCGLETGEHENQDHEFSMREGNEMKGERTPYFELSKSDNLEGSDKAKMEKEFKKSDKAKESCGCKKKSHEASIKKYKKFIGGQMTALMKKARAGESVSLMYGLPTISRKGKKIKGILAYAGVSLNDRIYLPEELAKGDGLTLPLLLNHSSIAGAEDELDRLSDEMINALENEEDYQVGEVTLTWDAEKLTLFYEGVIEHPFFQKEVDDMDMAVSLGIYYDGDSPTVCDEFCYTLIKGAEFREVSLVYHAGFPIATIEAVEAEIKRNAKAMFEAQEPKTPLDELSNDEAIASAGHRSTYSDFSKDKESEEAVADEELDELMPTKQPIDVEEKPSGDDEITITEPINEDDSEKEFATTDPISVESLITDHNFSVRGIAGMTISNSNGVEKYTLDPSMGYETNMIHFDIAPTGAQIYGEEIQMQPKMTTPPELTKLIEDQPDIKVVDAGEDVFKKKVQKA